MYQDRVDSLRFMVEAGHSMATKFEAEVISENLSRDEAQARFKQALLSIRSGPFSAGHEEPSASSWSKLRALT
jgi:hypothetical protein